MNLTKRLIETLTYRGTAPERDVRWDDLVPGFGVRIYPSGRKTFVISYRHQGRKRLMTFGSYGVLTLEQARTQARVRLSDVLLGRDPLAEAERAADGQTFKDLARAYLDRYARLHKKTWRDDASMLERYVLPSWGPLRITALKRSDIAARHREIGCEHPYAANRFVELMSKMFELAKLWAFVDEDYPNPARRIPAYAETKRDRFVTMQELPRLAAAIDEESSPFVRAAFWLYLFTGLRKRELLRAKWADIDFATGSWRIPETKSGRVHHLPLSSRVRALLAGMPRELAIRTSFRAFVRASHSTISTRPGVECARARDWPTCGCMICAGPLDR